MRMVLDDVHQALLPVVASRSLELRLDARALVPTVRGNLEELKRVVLNVLSNAIKFTPDGGAVSAVLTTDGEDTVLTVSDTGHGISEDDLPYVYDRFYRASMAHEWAIEGTGLGLAIVKSTVEQHGGSVTMTSALDRGTTCAHLAAGRRLGVAETPPARPPPSGPRPAHVQAYAGSSTASPPSPSSSGAKVSTMTADSSK